MTDTVLTVNDLSVSFPSETNTVHAVQNLSYEVRKGEALAIVGESGSGKSVSSLAVMGLLPANASVSGRIDLLGRNMFELNDRQLSTLRGNTVSMVFQDPLSALTPVYEVGRQISEVVRIHHPEVSQAKADARSVELLDSVGIPDPSRRAKQYPHEFSGGMRQRAMIAMAIANEPELIIADEPTTALDVTIQAQVMDLLKSAQEMLGAATVLITHDMGVVAGFAERVLVMKESRMVEEGDVEEIFYSPREKYTRDLLAAVPRIDLDDPSESKSIAGSAMAKVAEVSETLLPREKRPVVLEVTDLERIFPITKGALIRKKIGEQRAVDGISFDIREGECLALVGESGSGKTTTLLEIMQLRKPQKGAIRINGKDTSSLTRADRATMRSDVTVVFQDPMAALDPRMPISDILKEPMQVQGYSKERMNERVDWLLTTVGLTPEHASRYPAQFSGGQRQRVGVARALACEPKLIVLDEPTSALDVTVQAGVLKMLADLRSRLGVSFLFVSHDLSVVRHISDRIAVMKSGKLVEIGDTANVFDDPRHEYSRELLAAVPIPDPAKARARRSTTIDAEAFSGFGESR
ncbi:MAG: ABC transporter ATP-binding protein [Brevibacterium sp.]|uniref:Peptide/nickel transport system ATP-binding protein n=2 Tax=Brevibacteriaceae TaxID=85019 RepID=A0A2H1HTY5_BRELN|nr:ABC transporter ATP-binding protein [Brevibacterium linens]KAB1950100.1 ABC transporter ATP-binding protein [Brevibacterium linens ATCC 9172]SMX66320.1 peptide/nickel transport system ATP-binding protein [Brevibacterium linens ATCC 9172]